MERYQLYFAGNALILLAAIGLLWWSKGQREKRRLVIYISIIFLVVFNDIVYRYVAVRLGEMDTYYRFLWILPVNVLAAYLVIEVSSLLKSWKKGAFVIIVISFLLVNEMPGLMTWITLPSNVYNLDDNVIQIADIIDSHSGGKRVNVIDSDYTVIWHMREYDDNICYLGWGDEMIREIVGSGAQVYSCEEVHEAICSSAVRYVIVKKEFRNANTSLENAEVPRIGSTQQYNVYYTGFLFE